MSTVKEKLAKPVVFISPKYPSHHVILRSSYNQMVGNINQYHAGLEVRFHRGLFETNDAETVQLLRESKYNGVADGWYEDKTNVPVATLIKTENQKQEAYKHNFFCKVCAKGFETSKLMAGHLRSNAHNAKEKTQELSTKVVKGLIG